MKKFSYFTFGSTIFFLFAVNSSFVFGNFTNSTFRSVLNYILNWNYKLTEKKLQSHKECLEYCVKKTYCSSVNYFYQSGLCQLFSANRFSQRGLMLPKNGAAHFYLASKCEDQPCNNGTCVPDYRKNTFSCYCNSQTTHIVTGTYCEKILEGFHSANLHIDFENFTKTHISGNSQWNNQRARYDSNKTQLIGTPDRKGTVHYIRNGTWQFNTIFKLSSLGLYLSCEKVVTLALWTKIDQNAKGFIAMVTTGYKTQCGLTIGYNTTSNEFVCSITDAKSIMSLYIKGGRGIWTHLICTYKQTYPTIYINGKHQSYPKQEITSTSAKHIGSQLIIGYNSTDSTSDGACVDDIAIWGKYLYSSDAQRVFKSRTNPS